MDERRSPRVAGHLRAEHDVAERARDALGQLVEPVEREREPVRLLVDSEMVALQLTDLVPPDPGDPELALANPFGLEHPACPLGGRLLVDLRAAAIRRLDRDQRESS